MHNNVNPWQIKETNISLVERTVWLVNMYKEAGGNNEITKNKHQSFEIVWRPFLQQERKIIYNYSKCNSMCTRWYEDSIQPK